jgi:glutamyl-tRNA(Gln) amidotransferase subunit E
MMSNYTELGLKCGIEIHQQLEGKKLFCDCPTVLRDDEPKFTISRKLRASAGEAGKVDLAAAVEQSKDKTFIYEGYDTTCLVETDSEPPHEINQDALQTVLQFSKMVKANVVQVIQVMRKTVVDGSNTSGFQRTALVARNGLLKTSEGDVRLEGINIEEEACKNVSESATERTFRLDRLGIPLIEIGTAPDIQTPSQCQEVSMKLGMLLRSLPGIKRGLGSIRQDVNISIKGGDRIEVKGFQDLKMIPTLVELEVKRQSELLKIQKELKDVKLDKIKIVDLTSLLKNSTSTIIAKTIKNQGVVLAIKLNGFSGLIGREIQPGRRLGSEFSDRAKVKAGVGGIFHSDELPNYGITGKEVEIIGKTLKCAKNDAFVLVADAKNKSTRAMEAVYERAQEAFLGVPKEVRKDRPDGTTTFMRPMPGAARMYPETDVPLIYPVTKKIKLPELLDQKVVRYQKKLGLSRDLAQFVAKSGKVSLFEELVTIYPKIKAAFIADVLTSMLVEVKRKYDVDPSPLVDDDFRDVFKYLSEEKIHKDIILDVLIDMCKRQFDVTKYASLGTEEIHAELKEIIKNNPKAPFPALMGIAMKKLAGKASGKFIAEELKKLIR